MRITNLFVKDALFSIGRPQNNFKKNIDYHIYPVTVKYDKFCSGVFGK